MNQFLRGCLRVVVYHITPPIFWSTAAKRPSSAADQRFDVGGRTARTRGSRDANHDGIVGVVAPRTMI